MCCLFSVYVSKFVLLVFLLVVMYLLVFVVVCGSLFLCALGVWLCFFVFITVYGLLLCCSIVAFLCSYYVFEWLLMFVVFFGLSIVVYVLLAFCVCFDVCFTCFFVGRDVLACFCCCPWFPFFVCVGWLVVCVVCLFFYNGVWIVVVLFHCCVSLFVLCV